MLLGVTIGAGLIVHTVLPDTPASDIAGDALYALAVSLFVIALAPRLGSIVVGAIAAVWCVGVELFQLTGIPESLGAVFTPAMLVLGTVFDARDLLVYLLTLAVVTVIDLLLRRRSGDTAA